MSRRIARLAGTALVLLVVAAGTALAFNPHLAWLLREGFPDEEWPASGSFATIEGAARDADDARPVSFPAEAIERFEASGGRALLVARADGTIHEHYGAGYGRKDRFNSFSLVKSLVGALSLKAVAEGRLSLDDPISRFVPYPYRLDFSDDPTLRPTPATIRDALEMRTGLLLGPEPAKAASGVGEKPLDDAAFSPFGALARLHALGPGVLSDHMIDPIHEGRPGAGTEFRYQSANTAVLGMALEAAYGRTLPELLDDLLWKRAGAAEAHWRRYPRDVETPAQAVPATPRVSAYCCLYARPIDWARVGVFLLSNGTPDEPFLPDDLWREFIAPDLGEARRAGAYGLHIRHDVLDRPGAALAGPFAYMMGHGGQAVYLVPPEGTREGFVVVRFGREPQLLHSTLYELAPLLEQ